MKDKEPSPLKLASVFLFIFGTTACASNSTHGYVLSPGLPTGTPSPDTFEVADTSMSEGTNYANDGKSVLGTIYANDGTPFDVVPDPDGRGRDCAAISEYFKNEDGYRQDAYRLAQALGGKGKVTLYTDPPVTFDASSGQFPEASNIVHIGDVMCIEK